MSEGECDRLRSHFIEPDNPLVPADDRRGFRPGGHFVGADHERTEAVDVDLYTLVGPFDAVPVEDWKSDPKVLPPFDRAHFERRWTGFGSVMTRSEGMNENGMP